MYVPSCLVPLFVWPRRPTEARIVNGRAEKSLVFTCAESINCDGSTNGTSCVHIIVRIEVYHTLCSLRPPRSCVFVFACFLLWLCRGYLGGEIFRLRPAGGRGNWLAFTGRTSSLFGLRGGLSWDHST